MCCNERRRLLRKQFLTVARLYRWLGQERADGNELYEAYIKEEIKVARSLARLIHKHN